MQTRPCSFIVVGSSTRRGTEWLIDRFPSAIRGGRVLAMRLPLGELDAVLWAERLRASARELDLRVSVGIAGADASTGRSPREALELAAEAFDRAFDLGGDITVTGSNLVRWAPVRPRFRRSA